MTEQPALIQVRSARRAPDERIARRSCADRYVAALTTRRPDTIRSCGLAVTPHADARVSWALLILSAWACTQPNSQSSSVSPSATLEAPPIPYLGSHA